MVFFNRLSEERSWLSIFSFGCSYVYPLLLLLVRKLIDGGLFNERWVFCNTLVEKPERLGEIFLIYTSHQIICKDMKIANITLSLLMVLKITSLSAQSGPFAPAAGQLGSTAISKDSAIWELWGTGLEVQRGWINISDPSEEDMGSKFASFGRVANALGKASGNTVEVISLGDGGVATYTFDAPLVDGPGWDFAVFENGFLDTYLELAFVEVSSDGKNFFRFPAVSLTDDTQQIGPFGALDPTYINQLAGKYRVGFGTPFDLAELPADSLLDKTAIRFVRIIDVVGSIDPAFGSMDSEGNMINDLFPTPFASGGFDLEALGLIHTGKSYRVSHFEDLGLAPGSYENGAGLDGGFSSGAFAFWNNYNAEWNSWSGWAYSNLADTETPGFGNQFSAYAGGGMANREEEDDLFAVGTIGVDWVGGSNSPLPNRIVMEDQVAHRVSGMYVTNSTYAALSMKQGDSFAKKFGGADGKDADWFKLVIWGIREEGDRTDSIEFYLADFRFEEDSLDYIVDTWQWVDLWSLGEVMALEFILLSSDVGPFGMNTPAFFCLDQLRVEAFDPTPELLVKIEDVYIDLSVMQEEEVDLRNYFYHPDGDFSVFSFLIAQQEKEEIADFFIEEGFLRIRGINNGKSNTTLRAYHRGRQLEVSFVVTVDNATAVNESLGTAFKVFPNPCRDWLFVEGEGWTDYEIRDGLGQRVRAGYNTGAGCLSMENLPTGMYFLRLNRGNHFEVFPLLKQ